MLNAKQSDYKNIFQVELLKLIIGIKGIDITCQAHDEHLALNADSVLRLRKFWMGQWAHDVLRACNNYNQKLSRQSFFCVLLFKFLGLSRSGVQIMHTTMGGISLRTLDNHASNERTIYIDDAKDMMSRGICTWYADNYTHRYVRRALAYGEPGYHNMDTTVVAMGTCEIKRDRLRLGVDDLAVNPNALSNQALLAQLIKDCVEAVKGVTGKETLVKKYNVTNWPPKPDVNHPNLTHSQRGNHIDLFTVLSID